MDRGIDYSVPGAFYIQYYGYTTGVALNGVAVPLIGPLPEAGLNISKDGDGPHSNVSIDNATEPRPNDVGFVYGLFYTNPIALNGLEIPDLLTATPNPLFYFVAIGSATGQARYNFTMTDFSVTGTQPEITKYVPPVVPEPAAWAMIIGGFALAGAGLRRRPFRPGDRSKALSASVIGITIPDVGKIMSMEKLQAG